MICVISYGRLFCVTGRDFVIPTRPSSSTSRKNRYVRVQDCDVLLIRELGQHLPLDSRGLLPEDRESLIAMAREDDVVEIAYVAAAGNAITSQR